MAKNFTVRQLDREEFPNLAVMVGKILKELSSKNDQPFDEVDLTETAYMLQDDSMRVWAFIAQDEAGEPVGIITINEGATIYDRGTFGVITELYVWPSYRSSGVGSALIKAASQFSRNRGWKKLELNASNESLWDWTVDFFTKHGFDASDSHFHLTL